MNATQDTYIGKGAKNKKQIGRIGKGDKIYIEDYAVTYLNQIARNKETKNGFAGLFGTCREVDGVKEYYIYAAVYQESSRTTEGGLPRETVQKIMRLRGDLFSEYYFLGWAMIYSENKGAMWESCYRSRMESLMGKPELLMTIKCRSCEEHFYLYPTEMPKQAEGYFIFYEQNDAMQNFLIDWHSDTHTDKCDGHGDHVAASCRNYYKEKKAKRLRNRLAGASVAAIAVLVLFGAGTSVFNLNDYDKIKEVGQTLENINNEDGAPDNDLVPVEWEVVSESQIAENDLPGESGGVSETEDEGSEILTETHGQISQPESEETGQINEPVMEEKDSIAETEKEESPQEAFIEEESEEPVQEVVFTPEYVTYEVSQGDTLYGICVRFYGNLHRAEEICELNEIDDMDNILYGEKILLPQ